MKANFKKGEVLTADALNAAINSILPPRQGAVCPGQRGGGRVNRVPAPVLAEGVPVFLDRGSLLLPEGAAEGWYVRRGGELVLQPEVRCDADVFLVSHTGVTGEVVGQCLSSDPPDGVAWDWSQGKTGVAVRRIGRTVKNSFAGMKVGSCVNLFSAAGGRGVEPVLLNVGDFCAPDSWEWEWDLVGPMTGNSWPVRRIRSRGGLVRPQDGALGPKAEESPGDALELAPRVNFFPLRVESSCCAPGTGYCDGDCLRMGEWRPLASFNVGGKTVWLNGYWVTPWKVGLAFEPDEVGGVAPRVAWRDGAVVPLEGTAKGVGVTDVWRRVSVTPRVIDLKVPAMFPEACSYDVFDYKVLVAPGTTAPVMAPDDSSVVLTPAESLEWVAQVRRLVAPETGEWCVWDVSCVTEVWG